MARTPFKMKGSPYKQGAYGGKVGEAMAHWTKYKSLSRFGMGTALAIPTALYGFYKSGQKHSGGKVNPNQKSFMTESKKKTKSIFKK